MLVGHDGVKSNAQFLDEGCTPSEPFAVVRKSDHDERLARLLAHIDAQAEAHASELRRVRDVRNENAEDARREIASLRELMNAQSVRLEAAERLAADRLEQMNADRKQALVWRDQAELYEQVRKFSPREFQALWTKNVTSGAMFDDLVRAAIKEAKP